jgi:hypothetical protein
VAVRLKINAGSPTGTINVALYDNSGLEPTTVLAGADFTDFSSVNSATELTSEYQWFHFTVDNPINVDDVVNTRVHVVVRHLGAVAGNTVAIEEVTTPSGFSSGIVNESTDAATWSDFPAADLNFRVYGEAEVIRAIADYRLSDGSANRHLVIAGEEVYKNVDGVMTVLSNRDRVGLDDTASLGQQDDSSLPSWVVGQDRFLVTDNTNLSSKFYIRSGTEYYEQEGLLAPTADLVLAGGVGGGTRVWPMLRARSPRQLSTSW